MIVLCLELLNTRGWEMEVFCEDSMFIVSLSREEDGFPNNTARSILCPAVIVTFSVGRGTEETLEAVNIFVSERSSFQSSVPHSSVAVLHAPGCVIPGAVSKFRG